MGYRTDARWLTILSLSHMLNKARVAILGVLKGVLRASAREYIAREHVARKPGARERVLKGILGARRRGVRC